MTKSIMVFNDTQEILELFLDILTGEGYEVKINSFGLHEAEEIESANPDLVIIDCPPLEREQQGWQLVQKLKMSRKTEKLPIILASTSLKAFRESEGWLAAKGVRTLPKPFTVDELLSAVRGQLGTETDGTGSTKEPRASE